VGRNTTLLVLGGSGFVGRVIATAARDGGWSVTVLNRGRRTQPAGVEAIVGDRLTPDGLGALGDRSFDVVVDTWSGAPRVVHAAATHLAGRAGAYAYVSSRSVYEYPTPPDADERARVVDASADGDDVEYARAKAGGELAATAAFGDRALLVRAGLIIGPYEDVGRLPWWLNRIASGGRVPAPGPPELTFQYIDVRDLATWLLDAVAAGRNGPYNVVCPPDHATMAQLFDACVAVTGADVELIWRTPEQIEAAGVRPWTDLPIWLPPGELHQYMHEADVSRAVAAGLSCRPLHQTVAATWRWLSTLDDRAPQRDDRPTVGLRADAERALLAASDSGWRFAGPRPTELPTQSTSDHASQNSTDRG
jgi:2'-hydroxyisoflavone reductase